jgi:molybdate/tungstate transport system permease protein
MVFSKQQFLGETLFMVFGIQFDGTMLGICLAQVFVAMPFIMKSSIAAFDNVPHGLEIAARTLGASSFDSFRRVALPLAAKGLFLGAVLAWARAAGEFGALLFLAPYPETAPVAAYNRFTSVGLVETAPLVTTLLLFSLAMFFLLQLVARSMRTMYQDEER